MGKLSTVLDKAQTVGKKLDDAYQARMARAAEQGFGEDWYHGTTKDIEQFSPNSFFTRNPKEASEYADRAYRPGDQSAVYPVKLRNEQQLFDIDDAEDFAWLRERYPDIADRMKEMDGRWDYVESYVSPTYPHGAKVRQDMIDQGYTGFLVREDDKFPGDATERSALIFEPQNVRLVNAQFDPAKRSSSDLLASAAGAGLVGAAMAPEEAEAGPISRGGKKLLEAWHGSPHKFDKFDISKIGTGEGAQAYGHGLYFADSEGVARSYREGLSADNWEQVVESNFKEYVPGIDDATARVLRRTIAKNKDKSAEEIYDTASDIYGADYQFMDQNRDAVIGGILDAQTVPQQGALYRTEIDVDPDTLLDWDKPLSEQSEVIKDAAAELLVMESGVMPSHPNYVEMVGSVRPQLDSTEMRGGELIQKANKAMNNAGAIGEHMADINPAIKRGDRAASDYLRDRGIPGIRYKDAMSRGSGERETYNYVMFSDEPISIKERGAADPALLATLSAATAGAPDAIEGLKALAVRVMGALEAYDRPIQNVYGAGRTLYGLTQAETGKDVERALIEGAKVSQQDIGTTAEQIGDKVRGESNSPFVNMMGAAAKYGSMVFGP